jgi:type III secretory pathway component EscT
MFGGGFLFWVGCITESFSIWPIAALNINFSLQSSKIFELAFANFAQTAILWAAPAMVTLFIVDAMLGLANRFAPQLNVYSMSAAVKSLAAMFVWILMLTTFVTTAQDDILALIKNVIPMMLGIVPAASGR